MDRSTVVSKSGTCRNLIDCVDDLTKHIEGFGVDAIVYAEDSFTKLAKVLEKFDLEEVD